MRMRWVLGGVVGLLVLFLIAGCGGGGVSPGGSSVETAAAPPAGGGGLQPVLIGFKSATGPADAALLRSHGAQVKYMYDLIPAAAASLPAAAIEGLKHNPRIEYIEPDAIATAVDAEVPWGIERVNAPAVWGTDGNANTGDGVKVAIVDTGIDTDHPDLHPNYDGGYNALSPLSRPEDDNGHGTHCAGIAAAVENNLDVKGVAPSASLYAVKVLDASGSGYYSAIIAGIQWCAANNMQVASMSFGGSFGSKTLQKACNAAYAAGVLLVAAAGNSGGAIIYPAAYSSVVAVGATDINNVRASFSCKGRDLELVAPGVTITSDKLGGGTVVYTGTSMACPHVSGAAALVIASGRGSTPKAVRDLLNQTATDLGATGRDILYGYGLVNAAKACGVATPSTVAVR